MDYEKKQDPTTPPPPYASAPYATAPYANAPYQPGPYQPGPYQPGPYQPGPYQPGPYPPGPYQPGPYPGGHGVPYNQPYPQQPEGPYSPQQGPYAQGGHSQHPPGTHAVQTGGPQGHPGPPVHHRNVSMAGAIVLSCCVFWCCGIFFGAIAFILALAGQGTSYENAAGAAAGAIRLRNASYAVSVVGIVVGIIFIVTFALLSKSGHH